MADNIGIKIQVEYDYKSADINLKELLKRLEYENKLNVNIDKDIFKDIKLELYNLKKQFENINFDTSIDRGIVKSQENVKKLYRELQYVEEHYKQFGKVSFPSINIDPQTSEIKNFVLQLEKADGLIQKLQFRNFGESFEVVNINETDKINNVNTNNIYKDIQSTLKNIYDLKIKLINADVNETQTLQSQLQLEELRYSKLNQRKVNSNLIDKEKEIELLKIQGDLQSKLSLQQSKFEDTSINKDINNIYKDIESSLKEINNLQIKLLKAEGEYKNTLEENLLLQQKNVEQKNQFLVDNNLVNLEKELEIIKLKENLQNDLNILIGKQSQAEKQNTEELEKQIKLFKLRQENEISALQSRYKNLLNENKISGFQTELNSLNVNTPDVVNKMKEMSIGLQSIGLEAQNSKRAIDATNKSAISFSESIFNSGLKFAIWIAVGNAIMSIPHAIQSNIEYIIGMDTALTDLNKVVDITDKQMTQLSSSALVMGKELGQSSKGIAQGMAEFARYNKNLVDIQELTRTATMASNVTSLSVADASKALSTALVQFNLDAKESTSVLDSWNEIQNNFRVSAEDLAASISKVGSVAKQSGVSIQQLEGYTSAIVASMGISGDESGTACLVIAPLIA